MPPGSELATAQAKRTAAARASDSDAAAAALPPGALSEWSPPSTVCTCHTVAPLSRWHRAVEKHACLGCCCVVVLLCNCQEQSTAD